MPIKYITLPQKNFQQALEVSGFYFRNEPDAPPVSEPFAYNTDLTPFSGASGISYFATAASGEYFGKRPAVGWSLVNPETEGTFSLQEIENLNSFEGFNVSLLDETGLLVAQLATGYKNTIVDLDTAQITNLFQGVYGDADFTKQNSGVGLDPRKLRLRVSSHSLGMSHTGEFYLTSPSPDVSNVTIGLGEDITFSPTVTKKSGVSNLVIYASRLSGFSEALTGSGVHTADFVKRVGLSGPFDPYTFTIAPPVSQSGMYYKVYAEDNYGTGSGFLYPSSVKPFTVDPFSFSQVPSGITGKVVVSKTQFEDRKSVV